MAVILHFGCLSEPVYVSLVETFVVVLLQRLDQDAVQVQVVGIDKDLKHPAGEQRKLACKNGQLFLEAYMTLPVPKGAGGLVAKLVGY